MRFLSVVQVTSAGVTLRLARVERANEERRRRTTWATTVKRSGLVPIGTRDTYVLQRVAQAEMDAAEVGLHDVEDIADWLSEEESVLFQALLTLPWVIFVREGWVWGRRG